MKFQKDTIFANRYTLVKRLGKGGFSEVWLANDKLSSIEVALKIGDDSQEFCNELEMVHSLSHPNLLIPRHLDIWDDKPYLVMEYCSQGSCFSKIKKMTEPELWKLLSDVAAGLKCLHDHDVLHQDIKPDNILIDSYNNYVITDFGISTRSRKTTKKSEEVAGSRAYMAPERPEMSVRASDIWALGATIYEIIEGEAPFGDLGGLRQKADDGKVPEFRYADNLSDELKETIYAMLNLLTWDRPSADNLLEIAKDHSKIWEKVKRKAPASSVVNETAKLDNDKHLTQPFDSKKPHEQQNTQKQAKAQSRASLALIIALIAVLVIGSATIVFTLVKKSSYVETELNTAHDELMIKIDQQGYDDMADFRAQYRNLQQLKNIESSESYSGEKKYSAVKQKLDSGISKSWDTLSDDEKNELTQLKTSL